MGYDDWKTRSDDPGRSDGHPARCAVRCVDCDWRFTGHGIGAHAEGLAAGDQHHAETGHAVAYRGTVQARWTRTAAKVSAA
jgi:hypothetical protein